MVDLCNRANHICFHPVVCYGRPALQMQIIADADINIFLPCGFFPSIFFLRLISAVADWMSTILRHMVWPGVVASVVRRMNEVTVHWARLVYWDG